LDRDETEPCAGIALNHEPDPPATKFADPVEQNEAIGNVVEAPRHPLLAHPILHRQSLRRPTGSWSTLLAYTERGVFSGTLKKKLGLTLASAIEERGRVYRIADPANL
jgi:hypothetical protein